MTIKIRFRGVELTEPLRDQALRRLHFALSRFAAVIHRVELVVTDINGPRGGVDKVCKIRIASHAFSPVIVEDRDGDTGTAIDVATGRAARAVVRAIQRRRRTWLPAAAG